MAYQHVTYVGTWKVIYTYPMNTIKPVLKGWLQSSADPTQVSNTIRGAILTASAFIIFAAGQFFHITLSADDVISLATEMGTLAGAIWFFYGLITKGVIAAGTVKQ